MYLWQGLVAVGNIDKIQVKEFVGSLISSVSKLIMQLVLVKGHLGMGNQTHLRVSDYEVRH